MKLNDFMTRSFLDISDCCRERIVEYGITKQWFRTKTCFDTKAKGNIVLTELHVN